MSPPCARLEDGLFTIKIRCGFKNPGKSIEFRYRVRGRGSNATTVMFLLLAGAASIALPGVALGQTVDLPFPTGIAGYDQQLGVTVQSRLQTGFDAPGIQVGTFVIRPRLDQTIAYNSNPTGVQGASGSPVSHTAASVSANSLWSRNSLSATIGVDQYDYFSLPGLAYTDWNIGLAGGYTLGDSNLTAAYSHQNYHELGTGIGTARSVTPISDQIDTGRLGYTLNFNRFSLAPEFSASAYRYGTATIAGTTTDLSFLDRDVLLGGVTGRYAMSDVGSLVVVLRGFRSEFTRAQRGQPTNNSTSVLVLGGIDYQPKGTWRFRLLVGVENRSFDAAQYASQTTPIAEAQVIWTPTGVLTVTADLDRAIDDPQSANTNGFILTQFKLGAAYELRRDVILRAQGIVQYGEFLQQGSQSSYTLGGGADWLINRNVRLSFDAAYTRQTGNGVTGNLIERGAAANGAFNQSIVGLTLHLAI